MLVEINTDKEKYLRMKGGRISIGLIREMGRVLGLHKVFHNAWGLCWWACLKTYCFFKKTKQGKKKNKIKIGSMKRVNQQL